MDDPCPEARPRRGCLRGSGLPGSPHAPRAPSASTARDTVHPSDRRPVWRWPSGRRLDAALKGHDRRQRTDPAALASVSRLAATPDEGALEIGRSGLLVRRRRQPQLGLQQSIPVTRPARRSCHVLPKPFAERRRFLNRRGRRRENNPSLRPREVIMVLRRQDVKMIGSAGVFLEGCPGGASTPGSGCHRTA